MSTLTYIPEAKQRDIMRYRHSDDARRSLSGYCQAHIALSFHTGLPLSNIEMKKTAYGKPYIEDFAQVDFNISHSNNKVVVAISTEGQVGIDIEFMRKIPSENISSLFTEYENSLIGLPNHFSLEKFYKLWTLKESYLKFCGTGLLLPTKAIQFLAIDHIMEYKTDTGRTLNFKTLDAGNDYMVSLCTNFHIGEIHTINKSESCLYKAYLDLHKKEREVIRS